ncbi:MmgE/PrpD family protein [Achromobacter aegrifaciens]
MAEPQAGPLAAQLSAWALQLRFDRTPRAVQQAIANCLLYNLTMALAVDEAHDPLGRALRGIADAAGPARLFGGRGTRGAADAAFINASLITARGQNDTHPEVVTHIGCVVIPAVLAVADLVHATADRVLDALVVGYETIPRVAQQLAAETTRRGFRASSLYGSLGAALACSALLGLNATQTRNALSIATNLASGLLQTWTDGSQEWRLQIAKTSRDGVHAALLARDGVAGAEFCLEGRSGFGAAYAGQTPVLDFDGWCAPEMVFKPYPGCAFNQAPVQALRDLMAAAAVDAAAVERLEIRMNPADAGYPGVALHGPFESPSGAIMSAPFMLAATLLHGMPRIAHFESQQQRADLHLLSQRIQVHPSPAVRPWTCELELRTYAGEVHRQVFSPSTPFRLDWKQTLTLAADVAKEWPSNQSAGKFQHLVASTEGVESGRLDLAGLGRVVYTT